MMKRNGWLLLCVALLGITAAFAPLPLTKTEPVERTITVHARSYEYHPAIMQVNPGDRVTLRLVSEDVVHGIYIDGYGLRVEADPGQTADLIFVADKSGSFRLRCSVTCGEMHPFMIGKLVVGQSQLAWRGSLLALLVGAAALMWSGSERLRK
jgi:heme/copper-type cytochrome/quinol oxidase subunit 2